MVAAGRSPADHLPVAASAGQRRIAARALGNAGRRFHRRRLRRRAGCLAPAGAVPRPRGLLRQPLCARVCRASALEPLAPGDAALAWLLRRAESQAARLSLWRQRGSGLDPEEILFSGSRRRHFPGRQCASQMARRARRRGAFDRAPRSHRFRADRLERGFVNERAILQFAPQPRDARLDLDHVLRAANRRQDRCCSVVGHLVPPPLPPVPAFVTQTVGSPSIASPTGSRMLPRQARTDKEY